ncbi:hypothetical protein GCM10025868_30850 [Angustibacter aerolatus]|uniref:DUF4229 domain-containing protein n=1 Tax=Angustibacter aerolatus TaxID=1162965 RepID=A0ABQ6JM32_9ACTN|nr:hypothetical protein GCM10025868_30850 [Angustibacter aerolatus]
MTVVRYSLLRMMLLLGCVLFVWLVFHLVGVDNPLLLLVVAGALSLVLSFVLLRGPREEMARQPAERAQHRLPDDDAEDREAEGR